MNHKNKYWLVTIYLSSLYCFLTPLESYAQQINDIVFTSDFDETKQYYVELLPKQFNSKDSIDLLIGLHGHGADRWQFAIDERPECLAFRTFASDCNMLAITPNYRTNSWMGPAAEKDLIQIIAEAKSKYPIKKVFLVGGSMGGTSALTFAALHADLIDGVTAMNAHANHLEYSNFQDAIEVSFGGSKKTIPEEYRKRSAEYWPDQLTMPIAFTVGVTDTSVPPGSIYRLVNLLGRLNRKVLLIVDGTSGHHTNFENAYMAMKFMFNESIQHERENEYR